MNRYERIAGNRVVLAIRVGEAPLRSDQNSFVLQRAGSAEMVSPHAHQEIDFCFTGQAGGDESDNVQLYLETLTTKWQ